MNKLIYLTSNNYIVILIFLLFAYLTYLLKKKKCILIDSGGNKWGYLGNDYVTIQLCLLNLKK